MRGLLANVKTKIKKSSRKSIHAARGHQKKKQKTKKQKAKSKNDCRSTPWDRKLSQSSSAYACMQKKKVTLNTNHHVLSCTLTHITLQPLDDNRRRSTTTVTDGSNALLTLLQSVHQGDDNSRTRRTDRLRVFFFSCQLEKLLPRQKKKKEDDVRDRERRHHL